MGTLAGYVKDFQEVGEEAKSKDLAGSEPAALPLRLSR
jgi:hypothetical protein